MFIAFHHVVNGTPEECDVLIDGHLTAKGAKSLSRAARL